MIISPCWLWNARLFGGRLGRCAVLTGNNEWRGRIFTWKMRPDDILSGRGGGRLIHAANAGADALARPVWQTAFRCGIKRPSCRRNAVRHGTGMLSGLVGIRSEKRLGALRRFR